MTTSGPLDQSGLQRAVSGLTLTGAAEAVRELHPSIGSTNERARELGEGGAPEGSLVVALSQAQGRGRLGRVWSSPAGGLYLSLVLRPDEAMLRRLPVSLLAGLAAAEAIDAQCGVRADLKWPNDVQVEGRKVAGILGELTRQGDGGHLLVLGIGVNLAVDMADLPPELQAVAGTLREAPRTPGPEGLLRELLSRFEAHYLEVRRGGGALALGQASARMPLLGKLVRVRLPGRTIVGTAVGLGATGALILSTEEGKREVVVAGEVEEVRLVPPGGPS